LVGFRPLPKMGNSTIRSANLFEEAEGTGLLSFFGSARVNFIRVATQNVLNRYD
jgi:hypothetical protein